jgi:hypothetical protein
MFVVLHTLFLLMRSLLLTALLSSALSAVQAAPPGYRSSRYHYTSGNQPYHRPPVRLTFGGNLAYYNGDITSRLKDNTLRLGLGIGIAQSLSPHFVYGIDLSYFKLQAKDQVLARNYRFASTNGLLTTFLRYNLNEDKSMYVGAKYKPSPVQVFVQAGVGATLFDPTATQIVNDRPVGLPPEQRGGYPQVAAVLPVGAGVTLRASRAVRFTLEGLYYFTSTDLLDDISQRANPGMKDDFATVSLKMEYAFYRKHGKPLVHFD